jgi:anti-sigma regulatory factor (Ser/Thr protein kinase)
VAPDVLVATAAYQPEPKAAAAARRFVRNTLQAWVVVRHPDRHGLVDDAVLLTSELVTNAVVHAGTAVQVTCRLADGAVEVVVSDGHPGRLVPEAPGREPIATERTGGRGLMLPAALASAWGVAYGRASKAVWFRLAPEGAGSGLASGPDADDGAAGELADAIGVTAALAAAMRTPETVASPVPAAAAAADTGYQRLLSATVESARVAVGADAAFAMMPDEDGDLRLCAAVGSISLPDGKYLAGAPSVVTVPFVVDGQVTGLLAAAAAAPGGFGDPEAAQLQRLADRSGPALQRAWLAELERLRRGRIAALAQARGLLTAGLGRDQILEQAGGAVVPRLAPWCGVLLPDGTRLRTYYARHAENAQAGAVPWLLDRAGQATAPGFPAGRKSAARPGHRWPLVVGDTHGAPPGVAELAAGTAWGFPFGGPGRAMGVLVIGDGGQDRLPHDVAALAADLACRIGLALGRAGQDAANPDATPQAAAGQAAAGPDGARLVGHKS